MDTTETWPALVWRSPIAMASRPAQHTTCSTLIYLFRVTTIGQRLHADGCCAGSVVLTCIVHHAEHSIYTLCSAQENTLTQGAHMISARRGGLQCQNMCAGILLRCTSQQQQVVDSLTYEHDAAQDQHEDLQALLASLLGI